jgi:hypothetical protein
LGTSTLLAAQPAEPSPQSEQVLHEVLRLVRQLLSSSSGTTGPPSGGGSPRGSSSGSGSGSVSLHPLNAGGAATPPLTPLGLGQQQQQQQQQFRTPPLFCKPVAGAEVTVTLVNGPGRFPSSLRKVYRRPRPVSQVTRHCGMAASCSQPQCLHL